MTLFSTAEQVSAQQKYPRLNHAAVYVHSLEKSTDFYKNIIQLEEIPEPFHDGKHTWFKVGPYSQLHLITGAETITTHDKNAHLCFSVPDINAFMDKLRKHRIAFSSWQGEADKPTIRVDGIKQIYFTDPDGYWIEINDDYN